MANDPAAEAEDGGTGPVCRRCDVRGSGDERRRPLGVRRSRPHRRGRGPRPAPGARSPAGGGRIRSPTRAEAFAAEHGAERAHGSYRALIDDPEVDVVYIATPHPQHQAIALAAIAAGKHVLVEKAFTATLAGTRRSSAAARAAGVFAMEAMWTRFFPDDRPRPRS